ncbi:MAG: hypothetical protein A2857_06930 [Candidatus Levybacteria bacterium RIFCSPHIGHO2_01_FULL_36_15]|nr:MAG: hypothetical protein A2857_06930 [Candidatus Levybacteria bacterium RIFCSPHIGHO2_01_FULL_36_15]OGH38653.1 MAG: hypothetical protein A2905_04185 [Candidatus Levybacteria bacterium RIFCSPLOWO2_01_FULL_36_10]
MKWRNVCLVLIFIVFVFLHFYGLSNQVFIGDEASAMLSIDRMWDAIKLKDLRLLAYPFLFYIEPFRAVFSGTLLHFFGPDPVLLRLPGIIFSFLTFWLLVWIFNREKIDSRLVIISMLSFSLSALLINDRNGGADSQMRFLFLFTAYFLWQNMKNFNVRNLFYALVVWVAAILTMLDAAVALPGIICVFIKNRVLKNKKIRFLSIAIFFFLSVYFLAWMALPFLTYKFGFQQHYLNRGLFFYFSRVSEGVSKDALTFFWALVEYTSLPFALWLIGTFLLSFRIRKFLYLQLFSIPAWFAVILLNRSSFHVIMYAAFFFFQAVIVTNYVMEKYKLTHLFVLILFVWIVASNASNLFTASFDAPSKRISITFNKILLRQGCLEEATVRIYSSHGKTPPSKPCSQDNQ